MAEVIENERRLKSWTKGDNIFLAGFSQGSRMVYQVQLGQLKYATGGNFVIAGYPLVPLIGLEQHSTKEALDELSYYGQNMKWMMFHGAEDPIFPAVESRQFARGTFRKIGIENTILLDATLPGVGHYPDQAFHRVILDFVNDGTITDIGAYES